MRSFGVPSVRCWRIIFAESQSKRSTSGSWTLPSAQPPLTDMARRGSMPLMSITVDLPPDIEEQVQGIPDLAQRIAAFLRHQVEHEKWQKQRYSERARGLLAASRTEAHALRQSGKSRDELFREFMELHKSVTRSL